MTSPVSGLQMPGSEDIYHATVGCISSLEACLSVKPLMRKGWADNRLADLRLWASGVGALARPEASLDRRLQFQPKPRLVLTNLLLTLQQFIDSCRMHALNETDGEIGNLDNEAEPEGTLVSPASSTVEPTGDDSNVTLSPAAWLAFLGFGSKIASDSSTDSNTGDEPDEQQSETTLKIAMKDIDDIMDQLIKLGFAIRKSGTTARLRKADTSFNPNENEDLRKHLEFILLNNAAKRQKNGEDNEGSATEKIMQEVTPEQQHLILANLRRRHRFQYARRHQQKLDQFTVQSLVAKPKAVVQAAEDNQKTTDRDYRSQAPDDQRLPPPTEDSSSTMLSTAPPGNLQAPELSATTPSVAEGDILKMQMRMPAAASRVSVSVATMHYPSPPPTSQQTMGFKCPCCYQTLPEMFKDWSRWRKHLVEDLCPYTCPFPECPSPEVLYISRAAWRDHVLRRHGAGQYWECYPCVGTGLLNTFLSVEEFVSHNRIQHKDAISEDLIIDLQDSCRKIAPPNISQCPLCPWPQAEDAIPDAVAKLEHVANCIHEFSLNALPWAECLAAYATDPLNPDLCRRIEEWLECTEGSDGVDIQKIDIKSFIFLPAPPPPSKPEMTYIPEEYFAESSKESSQVERGSLSLDSDLPEVRGTYSDDMSEGLSKESVADQTVSGPEFAPFTQTTAAEAIERGANDRYTVGWICTLTTAYVAAQAFLDEKHDGPEYVHPNDNSNYKLGKIGIHNVVIAMSPDGVYGTASAAIIAKYLPHSFPNIRICLMVGIGGGVPSRKHDIRLGDVVVGASLNRLGSVFQYDFGKTMQKQGFQNYKFLRKTPLTLRIAVIGLEAKFEIKGHQLEDNIDEIFIKMPTLQEKYMRPDLDGDRLYRSDIIHQPVDKMGCAALCGDDTSALLFRTERTEHDDNPKIHCGIIASANQSMKDASIRDRLAAQVDVLCFEKEAAELPNDFPCLLIRGICDYSDSHKNEDWQGYAAMTAAAYTRGLLSQISSIRIEFEDRISDILKGDTNSLASIMKWGFINTLVDDDDKVGDPFLAPNLNPRNHVALIPDLHAILIKYVSETGLSSFFPEGNDFMYTVAAKAAELKTNPEKRLNNYKDIDNFMKLALYRPVFFCDDSSSMAIGTRWTDQIELVQRSTRISTCLVPAGCGIGLQFINTDIELDEKFTVHSVGNIMRTVKLRDTTKIGTSLEEKILKPLIYNILTKGSKLTRPVLVSCITDGCPSDESLDSFKNQILKCVRFLEENGYPQAAIRFQISQLGNDSRAKDFIRELSCDEDLQDILFCTTQPLDEKLRQLRDRENEIDRWLLQTLVEPIIGQKGGSSLDSSEAETSDTD